VNAGPVESLQRSARDQYAIVCLEHCGDVEIEVTGSFDVATTRRLMPAMEELPPDGIFLDHANYTVLATLRPRAPVSPTLLRSTAVRAWVSGRNDFTRLSVTRDVSDVEGAVAIAITVFDHHMAQSDALRAPGEDLATVLLHVALDDDADVFASVPAATLPIHVGCAPLRELVFDGDASMIAGAGAGGEQWCSATESGAPCFLFDNAFVPILHVRDSVTGALTDYTRLYRLWLVGGGPTVDTVTAWSDAKQASFNPGGDAQMWTPDAPADPSVIGVPNLLMKDANAVSWMAPVGAPWSSLTPRSFFGSPNYYLRVHFATVTYTNETYCTLATEATIRVHGLPMPLSTHLAVLGGVLGLFIAATVGSFAAVMLCAHDGIASLNLVASIPLADDGGLITNAGKGLSAHRHSCEVDQRYWVVAGDGYVQCLRICARRRRSTRRTQPSYRPPSMVMARVPQQPYRRAVCRPSRRHARGPDRRLHRPLRSRRLPSGRAASPR